MKPRASRASILERLDKLTIWSRGAERAPHKPLLLLLALGRFNRGEEEVPFAVCEEPLTQLLREFGPSRTHHHPEYPFWRLQNDGIWEVESAVPLAGKRSDPSRSVTRNAEAVGRFPQEIQQALRADPSLSAEIAQRLLAAHFPESLHQDILDEVGLSLERAVGTRAVRDPRFRTRVLIAYEYRCALCGLDLRIGNVTVALEAAHIRWHQAGGPDTEANGLALCSLHHKIFDLGAFTVRPDHRVLVSEQAHGAGRFEEVLLRYHGGTISSPINPAHSPAEAFLAWHRRQVFKEGARFLEDETGG